jgi:hypothetical protein
VKANQKSPFTDNIGQILANSPKRIQSNFEVFLKKNFSPAFNCRRKLKKRSIRQNDDHQRANEELH